MKCSRNSAGSGTRCSPFSWASSAALSATCARPETEAAIDRRDRLSMIGRSTVISLPERLGMESVNHDSDFAPRKRDKYGLSYVGHRRAGGSWVVGCRGQRQIGASCHSGRGGPGPPLHEVGRRTKTQEAAVRVPDNDAVPK